MNLLVFRYVIKQFKKDKEGAAQKALENSKRFKAAADPSGDDFLKLLVTVREEQVILSNGLHKLKKKLDEEMGNVEKTLEALKQFKEEGGSINADLLELLDSVLDTQRGLIEELHEQKENLDKESKFIKGTAYVSVVIIGLVVLATPISPVAAAGVAMAALSLASIIKAGKRRTGSSNEYQKDVKKHIDIVNMMLRMETYGTMTYMQEIRALIDKLNLSIKSIQNTADFANRIDDVEAGKEAVEGIVEELNAFTNNIEELKQRTYTCVESIASERDKVLLHML